MRLPDVRGTLADAIDTARRNEDLVRMPLEVAEALQLELKRQPDPAVVAAWADWAKLRSAAQAFAKAAIKRGDAVVRLAQNREDMDRAVATAVNAARDLLAELDELEPPDEVYQVVRR